MSGLAATVLCGSLFLEPSLQAQISLHKGTKKQPATTTQTPAAQQPTRTYASADQQLTVEPNETFFAMFAALNACGYDQDLEQSYPLRKTLRDEVQAQIEASAAADRAIKQICGFYKDHDLGDPSRTLSQYVSLGLFTTQPPNIQSSVKEADLPPDASAVLGFLPLLQTFYNSAKLHELWLKHQQDYEEIIARVHDPLHNVITQTDLYLKLPFTGVADRRFSVIIEPQGAPGQVNARNYGSDYYLVVSPSAQTELQLDKIRHTYLHYVLDPYALSRGKTMQRLQPLLESIGTAPLDEAYKSDITLLVIESLIKAIEIREVKAPVLAGLEKKQAEQQRSEFEAGRVANVNKAMSQGYILTRYFYDRLAEFENGPVSFKDAFGEMLYAIDVPAVKKVANETVFTSQGSGEVVARSAQRGEAKGIQLAESKLAHGDYKEAERIAQEVLSANDGDAGRALFVLAMAASKQNQMQEARSYFERTLQVAKEPRLIAWSHIYLGRIADLQDDRQSALSHYTAALNSGDDSADTKAAAQKGIDHPLQPPTGSQ
jgi:tetratricopeptide (TPR) repeat protein